MAAVYLIFNFFDFFFMLLFERSFQVGFGTAVTCIYELIDSSQKGKWLILEIDTHISELI